MRTLLLSLLMFISAPLAAQDFDSSQLQIIKAGGGDPVIFNVELALTPEEQATGLMNRESMAEDAGMLFVLAQERPIRMWMKNTLISLDMLFIAPDGTILAIAPNTTPLSEALIDPGVPVKAVLEINGGVAAEKGIQPGDKLIHVLLGP